MFIQSDIRRNCFKEIAKFVNVQCSPFREEIINVSGAIKLRVWQSGVWLAFLKCTTLRWIKLESFIYKIFQGSCKSWFKGRSFICYLYLYDAVINLLQIIFHTVCLWKHFVYFLKLSNNNFFWLLISRRKGVCAKFTYFERKKSIPFCLRLN